MTLASWIDTASQDREGWKYTSLRALQGIDFQPAVSAAVDADALPPALDSQGLRMVFVNGVYQPALSQMGELPSDIISGDAGTGYALTLPAQTCLATQPLELLCVSVKSAMARQSRTRLRLRLGAHARFTLLERHVSLGAGAAHAATVQMEAALDEQAKWLHWKSQDMEATDYHLSSADVRLAKGAYYDQFALTTGAALSRQNIAVTLAEPEAQTRLCGATLLRGSQHGDISTVILHQAPNTTSQEHVRSVLDGKARGVFQGKIIVAPGAQKSDGRQMSRALLLSGQAEADHKPELEIYADDVQCSHGSTVGQLDEDALFYLRSRGIPPAASRAMLVSAFMAEVIESIGSEAGRAHALRRAGSWHGEASS